MIKLSCTVQLFFLLCPCVTNPRMLTKCSHHLMWMFSWQLECVIRLVQMGCDVNAVSSRFKQTPIHTAALGGHPRCVLWLSQAGADVNRQVSSDMNVNAKEIHITTMESHLIVFTLFHTSLRSCSLS